MAMSLRAPMLIGEVTLTTRSMLMNRAGRPRPCTSAAIDRLIAPAAPAFAALPLPRPRNTQSRGRVRGLSISRPRMY